MKYHVVINHIINHVLNKIIYETIAKILNRMRKMDMF